MTCAVRAVLCISLGSALMVPTTHAQTRVYEVVMNGCHSSGFAGDLNGDGVGDFYLSGVGTSFYSGATGALLFTSTASESISVLEDVNADGVNDFIGDLSRATVYSGLNGMPLRQMPPDWSALTDLATGGDLDGDGVVDCLAVSGRLGVGGSLVLAGSGVDGRTLWSTILGVTLWYPVDARIVGLGADADGDGVHDVVVLALASLDPNAFGDAIWLLSGINGGVIWNQILGPTLDVTDVAVVKDVTGDGVSEVAVATQTGARLHDGASGGLVRLIGPNDPGWSIAAGGDIDGDARDEIVVGNPYALDTFGAATGSISVYSSSTGARVWSVTGSPAGDVVGRSVGCAGDVNLDNVGDLVACGFRGYVYSGNLLPDGVATPVGTGCASSSTVPVLGVSPPRIGRSFTVFVSATEAMSLATLGYSSIPSSTIQLPNGCSVFLRPGDVRVLARSWTSDTGTWVTTMEVPYVPALVGLQLSMQALVRGGSGLQWTNGIHLLVGM